MGNIALKAARGAATGPRSVIAPVVFAGAPQRRCRVSARVPVLGNDIYVFSLLGAPNEIKADFVDCILFSIHNGYCESETKMNVCENGK